MGRANLKVETRDTVKEIPHLLSRDEYLRLASVHLLITFMTELKPKKKSLSSIVYMKI